jgi:hypothetical protein
MRWIKPNITASFQSFFAPAGHEQEHESRLAGQVEDIRLAMLDALGDEGSHAHPQMVRRLRFAGDVQSLWYARSDLMCALASMHGESVAQRKMASLTAMFDGLLPKGMASRPTPLHD